MEADIRALYTDDVRAGVASALGVTSDRLEDLGGFESFVHATELGGRPVIVKATWSGRRTPAEMGAEQHFVGYLADHGAPVCRFVPLASGELLASVPAGDGAFHVTAQVRAPGDVLKREEWTDEVMREWGRTVGILHRLSAGYPGPPAPLHRPTWEEEHDMFLGLLDDRPEVQRALRGLLDEIAKLPRDASVFGAMHTDLHRGNLHWHEGRPYVFDFEDMVDFWFVSDLAIVLYYGALNPVWSDDRQADFDRLKARVFEGYADEYALPQSMWDALPLFMRIREAVLVAVIVRSVPEEKWSDRQRKYLVDAPRRLANGEPALGLRV